MKTYERLEKPYQEGWKAFFDGVRWQDNPYSAGTMEWCNWNDGKHDAADQATEQELADYFRKSDKKIWQGNDCSLYCPMKRMKNETEAEKAKRLARNKKARERHWRKTGVGDKTIKWMELHNWL